MSRVKRELELLLGCFLYALLVIGLEAELAAPLLVASVVGTWFLGWQPVALALALVVVGFTLVQYVEATLEYRRAIRAHAARFEADVEAQRRHLGQMLIRYTEEQTDDDER